MGEEASVFSAGTSASSLIHGHDFCQGLDLAFPELGPKTIQRKKADCNYRHCNLLFAG